MSIYTGVENCFESWRCTHIQPAERPLLYGDFLHTGPMLPCFSVLSLLLEVGAGAMLADRALQGYTATPFPLPELTPQPVSTLGAM